MKSGHGRKHVLQYPILSPPSLPVLDDYDSLMVLLTIANALKLSWSAT